MPENSTAQKLPDLFGMSGAARQINRAPPACRDYARTLHARGVRGVLRADNGDYYVTLGGIEELRKEAARRAKRIPGG